MFSIGNSKMAVVISGKYQLLLNRTNDQDEVMYVLANARRIAKDESLTIRGQNFIIEDIMIQKANFHNPEYPEYLMNIKVGQA